MSRLLDLYKRGYAPGKDESMEDFLVRYKKSEAIKKSDIKDILKKRGLCIDHLDRGYARAKCPIWSGGMTITVEHEGTPISMIIMPLSTEKEILLHERVHLLRTLIPGDKYEEFIAYQNSKKRLYRWLGPIFRGDREVTGFICFSLISALSPFSIYLALPLILLSSYLGARLLLGMRKFQKAKSTLSKEFPMELLTDEEIDRLAKGENIGDDTPRWRLIRELTSS